MPFASSALPRLAALLPYRTLAIAALSLYVPFVNYGFSGELIGGDASIAWALPGEQLRQVAGVYIDGPGLGYNGATGLAAAFPALTIAALLHWIGLPTAIVARLIIALYFFLAMLGALKLFEALLPSDAASRGAAFIAAVFYGVNRYTALLYFTAQTYFPMVYAVLPWILFGVVVGCQGRRARGIAIVAASLVFAGGAGSNPALFGVALCAVVVGAALALADGAPVARVLSVAGWGGVLGVICCAWWIVPLATSVGAGLDTLSAAGVPNWAQWMSERSSLLYLFKLDGYTGADGLPFAGWYASLAGSLLGYVPLMTGVAGLGIVRRRLAASALVAFTAAAFLSEGIHSPFGWAYQALLDHVPGFSIFRSPYVKWIALEAVLLALVFALGLAGLVAWLRASASPRSRGAAVWVLAAAAVAVVAYPWPAYAGRMLSPRYNDVGFLSVLPQSYRDVAEILRRDAGGARTVVLNGGAAPYPLYDWHYFGEDPLQVAVPSPVAPFETLVPAGAQMSARAFAAALRSLGTAFVAVHHDVRNPVASPQANALVSAGLAVQVYHSDELDLYRLRGPLAPVARLLDDPLVALPRQADVLDARVGAGPGGRLDAGIGLLVAGKAPLQILSPVTPALASEWASRFGWARDVTDEPGAAPAGSRLTFVPGNPLAVTLASRPCSAASGGLRVASPSRWRLGGHDLGAVAAALCFAGRPSGGLVVNGSASDPSARQIALVNGAPLLLRMPLAGPADGVALRLMRPGLPFRFVLPRTASEVTFVLPEGAREGTLTAAVRTLAGKEVPSVSYAGIAGTVTVAFSAPFDAGTPGLLFMKSTDPRALLALQGARTIAFSIESDRTAHASIGIDQAMLDSVRLNARDAAGAAVERVATPLPLPSPLVGLARLKWRPADPELRGWSATGPHVRLSSEGPPTEVHVTGTLLANDRYRIRFAYTATGYAELWTHTDGDLADRIVHLTSDGRPHRFDGFIFPVAGSNGSFIMRLRSSGGHVELRGATLRADGPNGAILAWHDAPSRLGGRIVRIARPVPWLFAVDVEQCHPCALSVGVSDPSHWLVRGAQVQGAFTAGGGSNGAWASITTGAATWLIDAGPGRTTVRLLYVPALIAIAGLVPALVAAAIVVLLILPKARRDRPRERSAFSLHAPAVFGLMLTCWGFAAAALGSVWTLPAEVVASAVWLAFPVYAASLWFGRAQRAQA